MSIYKELGPLVEIAMADLAEALETHQDKIALAEYVLTKLAMTSYQAGVDSQKQDGRRKPTNPHFPPVRPTLRPGREDDTPKVIVLPPRDED
jgi:hypothetical protein